MRLLGKPLSPAPHAPAAARCTRGHSFGCNLDHLPTADNFISLASLIYSGNTYLQQQARLVLERSGDFLKPNGQLPHHFEKDVPTYLALSGATQTGPNTFWVKSALM
jgi:hypothetical protein